MNFFRYLSYHLSYLTFLFIFRHLERKPFMKIFYYGIIIPDEFSQVFIICLNLNKNPNENFIFIN